jgi:nucleoside-diphosphate-sugar epimerase
MTKALVTGAGGFIGYHLTNYLKDIGYWVRGVDTKYPKYGGTRADEFLKLDLKEFENAEVSTDGVDYVFGLAADMGGMGFISKNHSMIMINNTLMNMNTLSAARINGVERYFFSSSACVYPEFLQEKTDVTPLKESDAYPAQPQDGYGWEKLTMEKLCQYHRQEYGMNTYIARFHNVYGPQGSWIGGREKAPAALCRKIAMANLSANPNVEVWGDGKQTRSFCYVSDIVEGIVKLIESDYHEPLNIGSDKMVTIDEVADIIAEIAGIRIEKNYNLDGPQGVRGRNSDNTKVKEILGWEPKVSLENGLLRTYAWIYEQVREQGLVSV